MDPVRERTAGWPTPYPGAVVGQAPQVPVALEAVEVAEAVAAGGSAAPWRTGDWFHSQVSALAASTAPTAIVRDGLAPIGSLPPAPPETSGEWFSQQLTAIATMDPGSAAGLAPSYAPGQESGSNGSGQNGQNGQNSQGSFVPAPAPFAPPGYEAQQPFPVAQTPAGQTAAPYLGPEMRPDYAHLATAQVPAGHAVVQIGDSLPAIAKRLLGDETRWVEIFELNRDQIFSADVILPGMVLRMPSGPKPAQPPTAPAPAPQPPKPAQPAEPSADAETLRRVTPEQLAHLGATDKAKFFAVLKPAAVAAEQKYGVPWQVTLAQVALESGWAKHGIGGFNVFGIKGSGPAGSVVKSTKEWRNGRYVTEDARFAKYNDYYEAVMEHGKLFHNGYYKKAINQFPKDHDPIAFINNIQGIYATSPTYSQNLIGSMRPYNLV